MKSNENVIYFLLLNVVVYDVIKEMNMLGR